MRGSKSINAQLTQLLCADKISTNKEAKTLKIQRRPNLPPAASTSSPSTSRVYPHLPGYSSVADEQSAKMSFEERPNPPPNLGDESDVEEEALVNDYREQVNFDDGMNDLDRTTSLGGASHTQDLQAQLAAAATPLEYQATLETKFASYDNYCSLFHYILNSDGPVELEVPSVCEFRSLLDMGSELTYRNSTIGRGM